jgi:hypothetical protein
MFAAFRANARGKNGTESLAGRRTIPPKERGRPGRSNGKCRSVFGRLRPAVPPIKHKVPARPFGRAGTKWGWEFAMLSFPCWHLAPNWLPASRRYGPRQAESPASWQGRPTFCDCRLISGSNGSSADRSTRYPQNTNPQNIKSPPDLSAGQGLNGGWEFAMLSFPCWHLAPNWLPASRRYSPRQAESPAS